MAVYFPSDSLKRSLDNVRTDRLQGGTLHAVKANVADAPGNLAADYAAHECDFAGYAAIACNSWAAAILNGSNQGETDETVRTWTATGVGLPQTVYGIYYLDAAGLLVFAEMNPTGGITLSAAGHQFSYQPVVVDARL